MTTSSNAQPPVRITAYPDFCRVIPLMLGFRPHDSVVLVLIRDRTMVMAARFDLPSTGAVAMEVARQCADLATRHDADEVVFIGYADRPDDLWGLLNQLETGLGELPCHLLVTDHEHYWEVPGEPGTPLPDDTFARHDQFVGRPILADRRELAGSVGGPDRVSEPTLEAMACAEHFTAHLTVPEQMGLVHDLTGHYLRQPRELPLESRIMVAMLVDDPFVREHARLSITRHNANHHVRLWQEVVDDAPDEIATGALCLLAMAAWLTGHGALMQVCLERAETLSPEDESVAYLTMLANAAVDPRTWDCESAVHESWEHDEVS